MSLKNLKQPHSGWSVITFIFPLCMWAIKEERKVKKLCKMHKCILFLSVFEGN